MTQNVKIFLINILFSYIMTQHFRKYWIYKQILIE
jgi:hypothetical protein